jgi:hypothetical protein
VVRDIQPGVGGNGNERNAELTAQHGPKEIAMDRTLEIMQAFTTIQAAATPEAISESHAAGVAAAHAAIAAKEASFIMDENNFNEVQNSYAIGWNSTWSSAKPSNA